MNFTLLQSFDSMVIQPYIPLPFLPFAVNELFGTGQTVAHCCSSVPALQLPGRVELMTLQMHQ